MPFHPVKERPHVRVFIPCKTHGEQQVKTATIHSTESGDLRGLRDIEGVLNFLAATDDELGVHFCIDKEGFTGQGAHRKNVTYGAAGGNTNTVHFELIGFARFTPLQWYTRPAQLEKLARWMAHLHAANGVPLKWSVVNGFRTHAMVSAAYAVAGGHWDPGPAFPKRRVMRRAKQIVAAGGWIE